MAVLADADRRELWAECFGERELELGEDVWRH